MYRRLESVQVVGFDGHGRKTSVTCAPYMTLFSAVFASAARVRLAEESLDCTTERYRSGAGKYADVEALAAAVELGMPYSYATMHGCALCNTLAVMQYLRTKGCCWHHLVCTAAAERGYFEMLRWAREHGCEWNEHTILSSAASSENVEMAAWVYQQPDAIFSPAAMHAAAANGLTAMCEWLHSEGSPWDDAACYVAARGAHLDTLRWLHQHGSPCHAGLVYAAAAGGSIDVMAYLQADGFVDAAWKLKHMLRYAGGCNKLAACQWLRQQGAEWPEVLAYQGKSWSGDVLAWARAEGCTTLIY
jgi:hypothetical protein